MALPTGPNMMKPTVTAGEARYRGYRFRASDPPRTPQKRMSARADRSGKVFGRLRVVEDLGVANGGYRWWGCVCECGEKVAVRSRELDRGHTRSCGCLQQESRAKRGGFNKLPKGHASRNELLASYIKSARDRGVEWGLDDDNFLRTVTGPCTYCGIQRDRKRKPNKGVNGGFWYTGIDRVDSAKGYVPGNVVPCCWDCNRAKGTLELGEFIAWLDRISAARSARLEHGEAPR